MKHILRKLKNLIYYNKYTDCRHIKLKPKGLMGDWECEQCGAVVIG